MHCYDRWMRTGDPDIIFLCRSPNYVPREKDPLFWDMVCQIRDKTGVDPEFLGRHSKIIESEYKAYTRKHGPKVIKVELQESSG